MHSQRSTLSNITQLQLAVHEPLQLSTHFTNTQPQIATQTTPHQDYSAYTHHQQNSLHSTQCVVPLPVEPAYLLVGAVQHTRGCATHSVGIALLSSIRWWCSSCRVVVACRAGRRISRLLRLAHSFGLGLGGLCSSIARLCLRCCCPLVGLLAVLRAAHTIGSAAGLLLVVLLAAVTCCCSYSCRCRLLGGGVLGRAAL